MELSDYSSRGKGIIAYHHAHWSTPAPVQAQTILSLVNEQLGVKPLAAVIGHRGTVRLFVVIPGKDDEQTAHLEHSLSKFGDAWRDHAEVAWNAMRR